MLLSYDDDVTDDPAMEADSLVMAVQRPATVNYDYLCILPPQWGLV